jgi:hypothetical protein
MGKEKPNNTAQKLAIFLLRFKNDELVIIRTFNA